MPYQSLTLADLQTLLYQRVEGKPWWSLPEATRALNEALRVWNAATGFWVGQQFRTTVPDDPYVAVTASMTKSARVLFNGIPLERASQADFDYGIPGWRSATTASSGHPSRPVYWAPIALNLLVIYPADAAGLNTITVQGVRTTPVLSDAAPGAYVDYPDADLNLLLGYAAHVLAFKVGGQTLTVTYPAWLDFLRRAGQQNQQFARSQFYRRVLGMDQQAQLFPPRRPVETPADQAAAAASQALGDSA